MRKARLGLQDIQREAERLRTLLNLGLHVASDDLGGVDFTTSTTGSYQSTGLSIAITPTRDVHCLALFRGTLKHSAANADVYYRIYEASVLEVRGFYQDLTTVADRYISVVLWGLCNLAGGTAYTFDVQTYMSTAGTLTLRGGTEYTALSLILAHKAVLA
jgi:hypothetical protein